MQIDMSLFVPYTLLDVVDQCGTKDSHPQVQVISGEGRDCLQRMANQNKLRFFLSLCV